MLTRGVAVAILASATGTVRAHSERTWGRALALRADMSVVANLNDEDIREMKHQ